MRRIKFQLLSVIYGKLDDAKIAEFYKCFALNQHLADILIDKYHDIEFIVLNMEYININRQQYEKWMTNPKELIYLEVCPNCSEKHEVWFYEK